MRTKIKSLTTIVLVILIASSCLFVFNPSGLTVKAEVVQTYTIDFHVTDAITGHSIPDAKVSYSMANAGGLVFNLADGTIYSFTDNDLPFVITEVYALGYNNMGYTITIDTPPEGGSITEDIQLQPIISPQQSTLTVNVVDANGQPVPDVNLDIGSLPDWWMYDQTTDSSGVYTYTFWTADFPLTLEISKAGYDSQEVVVNNPTGDAEITSYITLDAEAPQTYQLTGTITNGASNQPVSGAQVTLDFDGTQPPQTLYTDGNGEYQATYAFYSSSPSVSLTVSKAGYATHSSYYSLYAQDSIIDAQIYTLDYQWTQTFHVINHVTGLGVSGAQISISSSQDGPATDVFTTDGNGEIVLTFTASQLPIFIKATAAGYQEPDFPWGVDWHFDPFPPYAEANTYIEILPNSVQTFTIQLSIRDIHTTQPLANAQITIVNSAGPTAQVTSNNQGIAYYEFTSDQQNPIVTITSSATNYEPETFQWDFSPGRDLIHVFDMTPTAAVPPTITITPSSGMVGSSFVVSGSDFSKTDYEVSIVLKFDDAFLGLAYVGGLIVNDGSWSSITFNVPMVASVGTHTITATDENGFTASTTFNVTAPTTAIWLTPNSGMVGSSFVVSGSDFSKTDYEVSIVINFDGAFLGLAYVGGHAVNDGSWSSLDLNVPMTASVGTHTISASDENGFSASTTFTVTAPTTAIWLTPSSGPAGSSVVVSGSDFSRTDYEVSVSIYFDGSFWGLADVGGLLVNDGSWSSLPLTVPMNAAVGEHKITASDENGFTASTTLTVTPPTTKISVNPSSVPVGASFVVSGTDFSKTDYEVAVQLKLDGGFLGLAYVGGLLVNDGSWSSQAFTIPFGTSLGSHTITATDETGFTASVTFTVTAANTAITLNPTSGPKGSSIVVSGSGFSRTDYEVSIQLKFDGAFLGLAYVGGHAVNDGSWSSAAFNIPMTASVGVHTISAIDENGFSASATFTVTAPATALWLTPNIGPAGSSVTVSGSDFSKTDYEVSIVINFDGAFLGLAYVGGHAVNDGSWSSLALTVPMTASIGTHTISASDENGFTASATFTVTAPTTTVWLTPNSGPVGSSFVVSGSDFSKTDYEVSIVINFDGAFLGLAYVGGHAVNEGSWSSTPLTVPINAAVGSHTITATDENGYSASTIFTVTASTSAILVNPSSGAKGSAFVVSGTDFSKTSYEVTVTIKFDGLLLGFAYVGGLAVNDGSWSSLPFTVPINAAIGIHTITATDENGFTASANYTVTSHTISIVTATGHSATANHLSQTGIEVVINGPTLIDGTSLTVSTINFGAVQPIGTGTSFGTGAAFYDTQVVLTNGQTIGNDVYVNVTIHDLSFTSGDLMYYWNGENWQPAVDQHYDASDQSLSGIIPAAALAGTPIMITEPHLNNVPEYPLGILTAIAVCFIAIYVYAYKKRNNFPNLSTTN